MITYVRGSLFQTPAKVLINTVNTVGVMGKGVALEFKRVYPEMFDEYQKLCDSGEFKIGSLWLYKSPNKWVLNFPTKKHWRQPSEIAYINEGLDTFLTNYAEMGIHTIAFPALGCGNGELDFKNQVQPIMDKYLSELTIDVFIYPDRSDRFTIPEHLEPSEMRKWLRLEPQSLPFQEVWEDIQQIVNLSNSFTTVLKNNRFTVELNKNPHGLSIYDANSKRRFISMDSLSTFWHQLRDHGFSWRNIAPGGIDREVSYVTSIFNKLPYVKPVQVSEIFSNLQSHPSTGLQVLPYAFESNNKYHQASLFDLVEI